MQFYMNYTRWDMQMHQNRKADWAVTAQCYSNRRASALKARTVRRWNSRRVPEKVWFCVIVKKCTADRPPYKGWLGSRNTPFLSGIWKWTADRPRVKGGPSAVQRTGKQLSAMFLVVWMCKWRTVRRVRADHPQELRDAPARPPATSPATALVGVCS